MYFMFGRLLTTAGLPRARYCHTLLGVPPGFTFATRHLEFPRRRLRKLVPGARWLIPSRDRIYNKVCLHRSPKVRDSPDPIFGIKSTMIFPLTRKPYNEKLVGAIA